MAASLAVKLFAEFLGTFLLVVSVFASGGNFLMIGATLALIVFLIGGISGAPVNPAISAALWYSGTLNATTYTLYATAEFLGGLAAAYAYSVVA